MEEEIDKMVCLAAIMLKRLDARVIYGKIWFSNIDASIQLKHANVLIWILFKDNAI